MSQHYLDTYRVTADIRYAMGTITHLQEYAHQIATQVDSVEKQMSTTDGMSVLERRNLNELLERIRSEFDELNALARAVSLQWFSRATTLLREVENYGQETEEPEAPGDTTEGPTQG